MRTFPLALITPAVLLLSVSPAHAWVYPEHRDIAVLAVEQLDAEHRAEFDLLWQQARVGSEARLCSAGADAGQGVAPECIDWAALPAIAGDHSCSSRQMLDTVRSSDWILAVADVGALLKLDLANLPVTAPPSSPASAESLLTDSRRRLEDEKVRAQRINALRAADIRLQRADPEYATRADSNNAHFLRARPNNDLDVFAYTSGSAHEGVEVSALGVYTWYHASALEKAARLREPQLSPQQRAELARSALFDEAFALHFLEDVYAAGHVAGSWGDASQRKGTHDYYNEHGLEVFTWGGSKSTVVLMGDAHMRPQDAEIAARTVQASLEQVLDAATAGGGTRSYPDRPGAGTSADDFDVCANATMPAWHLDRDEEDSFRAMLVEVVPDTPVPGLTPGLGAMPRARAEIGPFIGLSSAVDASMLQSGFSSSQTSNGWVGGMDVNFRVGMGLEGVLGDAGDGLVFAQLGWRGTSPSTNRFSEFGKSNYTGNLTAAIPSESGLALRLRMPFYIVPGDLLLMSPLYLINPKAYTDMAVTASNGGLIPWQLGMATRFGRFQFVLGRELGINFYGMQGGQQTLSWGTPEDGILRIVNFKSINYQLPVLEYRPYRAFSFDQASSLLFQLFVADEMPYDVSVDEPKGAPKVHLNDVWSVGLRMTFTWRRYWQ